MAATGTWDQYSLPPEMVAYEQSTSYLNPSSKSEHVMSGPRPILPRGSSYAAMDAEPHFRIHYQEQFSQRQLALVFIGGFFWLMMIIGLFAA